jgi:hypothetical protein
MRLLLTTIILTMLAQPVWAQSDQSQLAFQCQIKNITILGDSIIPTPDDLFVGRAEKAVDFYLAVGIDEIEFIDAKAGYLGKFFVGDRKEKITNFSNRLSWTSTFKHKEDDILATYTSTFQAPFLASALHFDFSKLKNGFSKRGVFTWSSTCK